MAVQRQAKIERYRQKKMTEDRLVEIKKAVDSEKADEEVVRDFYLLTVKKWINIALEETDSIDQELEILKRMDIPTGVPKCKHPPRPPMKPFVLTKDAVQVRTWNFCTSVNILSCILDLQDSKCFSPKRNFNLNTCLSNRHRCLEQVIQVFPQ